MQIVGARVLVSRIEEKKEEGFQTAVVDDTFTYKGKVEAIGIPMEGSEMAYVGGADFGDSSTTSGTLSPFNGAIPLTLQVGNVILFAKYSPDTHLVKHDGKEMKIVSLDDILAIL